MQSRATYISLAISALIHVSEANSSEGKLALSRIYGAPSLEMCIAHECHIISLPEQLKTDIENGYINITTINIDHETKIVAATASTEGSANICSKLYRVENLNSTLIALTPTNEVCNYSIKKKRIISKYKDAASWTEEVYRIEANKLILEIRDKCADCDQVFRTTFENSSTTKSLVTPSQDYELRKQITSTIKTTKAPLYAEPNEQKKTKMHLIKDDQVELLDYTSTEECWYLIKYKSPKRNIEKWLKCSDLDL